MRSFPLSLLLVASGAFVAGFDAHAEPASIRTAAMPFSECLSIIAEVSQDVDEEPVILTSTSDLQIVRINAADGFVTVSCSRADNKMTLTKSAVPAAAGTTAAR
jgi:hypothetical protein